MSWRWRKRTVLGDVFSVGAELLVQIALGLYRLLIWMSWRWENGHFLETCFSVGAELLAAMEFIRASGLKVHPYSCMRMSSQTLVFGSLHLVLVTGCADSLLGLTAWRRGRVLSLFGKVDGKVACFSLVWTGVPTT